MRIREFRGVKFDRNSRSAAAGPRDKTKGFSNSLKCEPIGVNTRALHQMIAKQAKTANAPR
jgi:hypothetical protein